MKYKMNPELFVNQYMSPAYISTTNMMIPFSTIQITPIYNNVVDYATLAWQMVSVFVNTIAFIAKEEIDTNLSFVEKILLCLCLYNLIALFVKDIDKLNENQRIQEKLNKLEKMEKDMKFLQKSVVIRDRYDHILLDIINIHKEQSNTIKEIERELRLCKEFLFTDENNIVNRLRPKEQQNM